MFFKGPAEFKRRGKVFSPLSNPEIKDAYMKYKGHVYPLITNTLEIRLEDNKWTVWHDFDHFDEKGERVNGRWYDFDYPVEKFKLKPKRCLRLVCDYYETWDEGEGGKAKFYIFFSETSQLEIPGLVFLA